MVALDVGDPARGDEARDLGGDGRRGVTALLLPALVAERRTVGDDEVGGLLDVVAVERRVAGETGLQRHEDRVRRLVELVAAGVGRDLAVGQAVARHPAVGQLLALEEEAVLACAVATSRRGEEAGEGLVQVAGEDLAVGAEVDRLTVDLRAGGDGLPQGLDSEAATAPGRSCPRWP